MVQEIPKIDILVKTPKGKKNFSFFEKEVIVGRSKKSNLPIPLEGVSRKHFNIKLEKLDLYITDLGSVNGILINGRNITPLKKTLIKENDLIEIPGVSINFSIGLKVNRIITEDDLDEKNFGNREKDDDQGYDFKDIDEEDRGPENTDVPSHVSFSREIDHTNSKNDTPIDEHKILLEKEKDSYKKIEELKKKISKIDIAANVLNENYEGKRGKLKVKKLEEELIAKLNEAEENRREFELYKEIEEAKLKTLHESKFEEIKQYEEETKYKLEEESRDRLKKVEIEEKERLRSLEREEKERLAEIDRQENEFLDEIRHECDSLRDELISDAKKEAERLVLEAEKDCIKKRDENFSDILKQQKENNVELINARRKLEKDAREYSENLKKEADELLEKAKEDAENIKVAAKKELEEVNNVRKLAEKQAQRDAEKLIKESLELKNEAKVKSEKILKNAYATAMLMKNTGQEKIEFEDLNNQFNANLDEEYPQFENLQKNQVQNIFSLVNNTIEEMDNVLKEKQQIFEEEHKYLKESEFKKLQLEAKEEAIKIKAQAENEAEEIVRNAYIHSKMIEAEGNRKMVEKRAYLKEDIEKSADELEELRKKLNHIRNDKNKVESESKILKKDRDILITRRNDEENRLKKFLLESSSKEENYTRKIKEFEIEYKNWLDKVSSSKKSYDQLELEIHQKRNEINKEVNALTTEKEKLILIVNPLNEQVIELREEKEKLNKSNSTFFEDLNKQKIEYEKLKNLNETLNVNVEDKKEELDTLRERLHFQKKQFDTQNSLLDKIDSEINEKRVKCNREIEILLQDAKKEESDLRDELKEIRENKLTYADEEIQELKREAENEKKEIIQEGIDEKNKLISEGKEEANTLKENMKKRIDEEQIKVDEKVKKIIKRERESKNIIMESKNKAEALIVKTKKEAEEFFTERKSEGDIFLQKRKEEGTKFLSDRKEEGNKYLNDRKEEGDKYLSDRRSEGEKFVIDAKEDARRAFEDRKKEADKYYDNRLRDADSIYNEKVDGIEQSIQTLERESKEKIKFANDEFNKEKKEFYESVENEKLEIIGTANRKAKEMTEKARAIEEEALREKDLIIGKVKNEGELLKSQIEEEVKAYQKAANDEISRNRIKELEIQKEKRREVEIQIENRKKNYIGDISENVVIHLQLLLKSSFGKKLSEDGLEKLKVDVSSIVDSAVFPEKNNTKRPKKILMGSGKITDDVKKFYIKVGAAIFVPIFILILNAIFPKFFPSIKNGFIAMITTEKSATDIYLKKEMEKKLNRPKFEPILTEYFRDNYTENIIYTKHYSELCLDPVYIKKWTIALHEYLVDSLELNENVVVKLISLEGGLHRKLLEERRKINVKFVDRDIEEMRVIEKGYEVKIMELFEEEKDYGLFKDFKKSFYRNYKK